MSWQCPSPAAPVHHFAGPFQAVFSAGERNFSSFRIPTLVSLPDNTIIAYSEVRGPNMSDASDDNSKHLVSRRSTCAEPTLLAHYIITVTHTYDILFVANIGLTDRKRRYVWSQR